MSEKRPAHRPAIPQTERHITVAFSLPPELAERIKAYPPGQRSVIVARALEGRDLPGLPGHGRGHPPGLGVLLAGALANSGGRPGPVA